MFQQEGQIMNSTDSLKTSILLAFTFMLIGCSTVTFMPVNEDQEELKAKPKSFQVEQVEGEAGYDVIGTVSCQDSASSSIWNWWTDNMVLIQKMKKNNREKLHKKVRQVGGDVLIDVQHELWQGGQSAGNVGVGVGTGVGGVGVGVGTSLFSSGGKLSINSHGKVGVRSKK
jgi:hypothetical protein